MNPNDPTPVSREDGIATREWFDPREILAAFYEHPFIAQPADAERLRSANPDVRMRGSEQVLLFLLGRLRDAILNQAAYYRDAADRAGAAEDDRDELLEALRPFVGARDPTPDDITHARRVFDRLRWEDENG